MDASMKEPAGNEGHPMRTLFHKITKRKRYPAGEGRLALPCSGKFRQKVQSNRSRNSIPKKISPSFGPRMVEAFVVKGASRPGRYTSFNSSVICLKNLSLQISKTALFFMNGITSAFACSKSTLLNFSLRRAFIFLRGRVSSSSIYAV